MDIVRVLKRKDAAALVVGVVVALIVSQFLSTVTGELSKIISGVNHTGAGWQVGYLYPVVWMLVQLVAFEVLIRIYVVLHNSVSGK